MNPTTWLALLSAISFEAMGTTLVQQSQQFTNPWPAAGPGGWYTAPSLAPPLAL